MQGIRIVVTLGALLLAASCAPDAGRLTAPEAPLTSAGTRTYTVYAVSWWYNYGTGTTQASSTYNGGYMRVEQVSDADGSASQLGTAQSGSGTTTQSYSKPDGYSLRLTGVATDTRCRFWRWVLKTPSGSSLTIGGTTAPPSQINMDSYSQYSSARADFFCS